MNDQDAVEVTCTDNDKKVTGYILNYRAKDQLEISLNTVYLVVLRFPQACRHLLLL